MKDYTAPGGADPKTRKASHGLTYWDLNKLALEQAFDEVEMMPANNAPDVLIPVVERNFFHVRVESPHFDQTTGHKLSKPQIKQFNKQMFESIMNNNGFLGEKVEILHDPDKVTTDDRAEQYKKLKDMKAEQAAIDAAKAQAADPASQGDNDTKLDTIDGGVITDGGPAHQWPIIEEPTKAEGGIVDDLPNAPSLDDIPKQKTTEL